MKLRPAALNVAWIIGTCIAAAASAGTTLGAIDLRLIPAPKQVTEIAGTFSFTPETAVVLGNTADSDDSFAAGQLVEEVGEDSGVTVKVGRQAGAQEVLIGRIGRDPAIDDAVGTSKESIAGKGDEAYILIVQPGRVVVAGAGAKGTFYGVQTLKQLVRANAFKGSIPACRIVDWPVLKYRGWQDDVSRGPIPTLDYLKREIRLMSQLKQNMFTLYTEHVFKLEKHPTIAPPDGITAAEIRELSAYARKYHVELVGNFQSFGHFANILNVKGYENLGEAGWIISPGKNESYQFLADVYDEIAPAYDGALFNINCDEVDGLGTGASKEMVAKLGMPGVYAYHINRIAEMLKAHGKTPMMWGDIAVQHREIVEKLPKDLIVMSWGYNPQPNYDAAIEPFTKLGFKFMVCPGIWSWNQIWPSMNDAVVNIANYTRDGARLGAMGVLNTSWDDSGENLFNCNWYSLAWGAECAWNPAVAAAGENPDALRDERKRPFDRAFGPVFYASPDSMASEAMWKLQELRTNPLWAGGNDSIYWEDPFAKALDLESARKLVNGADEAIKLLQRAQKRSRRNADTIDAAIFSGRRLRFMGQRIVTIDRMSRSDDSERAFASLMDEAASIRAEYKRLWRTENRNWWLDRILPKYDVQMARMKQWPAVVFVRPAKTDFEGTVQVELQPLSSAGKVHYTLDSTEPAEKSPMYAGPITLDRTTTVKARNFLPDGRVGDTVKVTYSTLRAAATFNTTLETYQGNGPQRAFDGLDDTFFWSNRGLKTGDTFTVVLKYATPLQSINVFTGYPERPGDILREGVLEISADGTTFETIGIFKDGQASAKFPSRSVKAIRLRATADQQPWLSIREIEMK
jgi:hexosaminidase